jgi:hypothetical protein
MANIGLAQLHDGQEQEVLMTAGDDAANVARFLAPGHETYSAADVIASLLEKV